MSIFDFGSIPIYALDISDQSFKFLRLTNLSGGIVVKNFGEGTIGKEIVKDGEIKDKNGLSAILKDVFLENDIKFVALLLPEEKGFLREIKISGVTEKELPSALEFQIEEHVPLPATDIFFDYTVTEKANDSFDLIVNAFPKNIVESYLDAVSSSGALPVVVESELESIARSVMPTGFLKTTMIVDWGKTRASFSVFENGILHFASTVPLGGDLLIGAISKDFGISKSEAVKLKFKIDISDHKNSPKVFNTVLPIIKELLGEIQKIFDFWKIRPGAKDNIEQIFLSGGDSNLFGLSKYLQDELEISVNLANPWANIKFPPKYLPPIKFKDSLRFSSAIGLSLKVLEKEKII